MKNVFKTSKKILLTVAMLTAMLGNANEATFTVKDGLRKTALTINNVKEGNLLSIKDNNGITLYKELIQSTGTYSKGFDLTALPDGDYFFEVDKDFEISTIPFIVDANDVVFNKVEETTIFKPAVRQKEDFVFITQLALDLKPVKIRFYADYKGDYELIFSDTIENTQLIKKAYKIEKGSYKIVINSNNKEYTKFIN